jgi:co-chaperonin GroES (HSP10)
MENSLRCPVTYLIVKIEKKLTDTITFKSGTTLFVDPNWHPEEFAALEAEIIGVPGRSGYSESDFRTWGMKGVTVDMKPGDKVLMDYSIVTSYVDQPDKDTPIYKNLFMVEGKEYWKCAIGHVFAYVREGVIHMVNGWVMGDILEEEAPKSSLIIIPDNIATVRHKDRMRVRHIGPNLPHEPKLKAKEGDLVYIDPKYVQEYRVNEDHFYIVRQSRIQGYA